MSVEIIFRGVLLFKAEELPGQHMIEDELRRLRKLGQVWIPNGTPDQNGKHDDDTIQRRHYAGLVLQDGAGNIVTRHNLDAATVTIADALGGDCGLESSFYSLPDFGGLLKKAGAPGLELLSEKDDGFRRAVTTVITMSGGSIAAVSGRDWHGPLAPNDHPDAPKNQIAFQATWRTQSPMATVTIADSNAVRSELILDANHPKAYVYNYDIERPSIAQLSGREGLDAADMVGVEGFVYDDDFKWLYRMLKGSAADKRKFAGANGGKLPAPRIAKEDLDKQLDARNPTSGGCYPGRG